MKKILYFETVGVLHISPLLTVAQQGFSYCLKSTLIMAN